MAVPSLNNVEVYLNQPEYFGLLKLQLIKDFDNEAFEERVNELSEMDAVGLETLVVQYLDYAFKDNQEAFMQLMYKIDIPDGNFKTAFQSEDFLLNLGHLVMKRELLKVVIRKLYSSN